MNLAGRTREQLDTLLADKSRSELIDLIDSLVTVEILLKPADIAARSCVNKRAILRDIRDGKFGDYYLSSRELNRRSGKRRESVAPQFPRAGKECETLMTISNCPKIPIDAVPAPKKDCAKFL